MSKRTKRRKVTVPARFKVGQHVRVRQGTRDEDYSDISLGGWAGTVIEIHRHGMYSVQWSRETLAAIHPIYRRRCAIDGMMAEEYYLREDDLEPDPGGPLAIEQPTQIAARRLSPEKQADRVRIVFGRSGDEFLPNVDNDSLETYYDYLEEHLSLPVQAKPSSLDDFYYTASQRIVTVVGLDREIAWDDDEGIMCEIRAADGEEVVPLSLLQFRRSDPNRRLVEDFTAWFEGDLWEAMDDDWDFDTGDEPGNGPEEDGSHVAENATFRDLAGSVLGFFLCAAGFGAVAGTTIAAIPWAKWTACVCGGLWAAVVLLVNWRFPPPELPIRKISVRRVVASTIGALAGGVQGGFFGILAATFVGTGLGAIVGIALKKAIKTDKPPLFQFFPGIIVCSAAYGALAQAFYLNPPQARLGLWYGTLIAAGGATCFCLCVIVLSTAYYAANRLLGSGKE
jgi:hypothetical protein